MKTGIFRLALVLLVAYVPAIAQQSLTRPAASQVIQRHTAFTTASVLAVCDPAKTVEAGVREGIWRKQGFGELVPTSVGRKYFARLEGFPSYQAQLAVPAKREVVAVTGITDEERNSKLVLFTWRYVGLAEVVARYTCQGSQPHEGEAYLRLYDDGWRVERLEVPEGSRVAFAGVSSGVIKRENDFGVRKEEADRIARIPTRKIGTYRSIVTGRNPNGPYQVTNVLEISDVDVRLVSNGRASEAWFGDIGNVDLRTTIIDGRLPRVPNILVWHKDGFKFNQPLLGYTRNTGDLSEVPQAHKVLVEALQSWRSWYEAMLSGAAPLAPREGRAEPASPNEFVPVSRSANSAESALEGEASRNPSAIGKYTVRHAHAGANLLSAGEWPSCLGVLLVFADHIEYAPVSDTDGQRHPLTVRGAEIAEVALNRLRIGEFDAFHITLTNKQNLNFTTTDDRRALLAAVQKSTGK